MDVLSLQQEKVYIEVIRKLNRLIQEDGLKGGDKLPSERDLSYRLQVGRSSVREALRSLELLDLIETKRGEGTFIKEVGGHRLVEILASFFLKEKKARDDLAETRRIIELEAVRLCCTRINEEQLQRLAEVMELSKRKFKSGEIPYEEDYTFHKTIVEACNNRLLLNIWVSLVEFSKASLKESLSREGRIEASIQEHKMIFSALKERSEKEAVISLNQHFDNSCF